MAWQWLDIKWQMHAIKENLKMLDEMNDHCMSIMLYSCECVKWSELPI